MGNVQGFPSELIMYIAHFLNDKHLIRMMSCNRYHRDILINDNVWQPRMNHRFNNISSNNISSNNIPSNSTSSNNVFQEYIRYHVQELFVKHFTIGITSHMIKTSLKEIHNFPSSKQPSSKQPLSKQDISLITSPPCRDLIYKLFYQTGYQIHFTQYKYGTVRLLTHVNKSVKGRTQKKHYTVAYKLTLGIGNHGNCYHGLNGYLIKRKQCENISLQNLFIKICGLLDQGYHIVSDTIDKPIALKYLNLGMITIS